MTSLALAGAARPAAHRVRTAPAEAVRVDDLDLAAMNRHGPEWDALVAEAADPAPFFTRQVINAHAAHGLAGAVRFLVARSGPRLVALLPYRPDAARLGFGARANAAWSSPFAPCSTPLVAADDPTANLAALLDAMARSRRRLWLLPHAGLDSEVGAALLVETRRRGWPCAIVASFSRPVLDRRADYECYAREIPPGRRKDLGRRWRRLHESGAVAHAHATEGEALRSAVESFIALEASGWKGARRTAFASRPDTAAFGRALFADTPGPVCAMADTLLLDGRVIAASLSLVCRGGAYLLKTAYDESCARFAPGLLLEDAIVRRFHAEPFAARLNSAATTATPLDELYPDREAIGDLVIAADPAVSQATLDRLARREALRRAGARALKDLYWRAKGAR